MEQSSKGRHQAPRSRALIAGLVAAGALAVGGVGYGVTQHGNDDSGSASSAPSGSASSASQSGDAVAAGAGASSGSASGSSAACQATVKAGDQLAKAAAASARDWRAHASAQWDLDAGKITYAQAEQRWAASKKNGPQDLKGYASAKAAYDKVAKGCGGAGAGQGSTATECSTRAAALAKVATTGNAINTEWSQHVDLMKTKDYAAGPRYHAKWMGQTGDARKTFVSYDSAVKGLQSAPACS